MWRSVPQIPVFWMRISTSLRPHFGRWADSSAIPGAPFFFTRAGICLFMRNLEWFYANFFVFDPMAGVVGLQRDAAGLEIFELMIFHHVLSIDPDQAVPALHDQLHQVPLFGLNLRITRPLVPVQG